MPSDRTIWRSSIRASAVVFVDIQISEAIQKRAKRKASAIASVTGTLRRELVYDIHKHYACVSECCYDVGMYVCECVRAFVFACGV